ncbi:hypothetical protein R5R35_005334 [Gryllus longicercus]
MAKARVIYLATCLKDCIEDCNIRDLREILKKEDSDPNFLLPELNYTPFHAVAGSEDEDFAEAACRLFLIHNGNPNVKADEDLTPVHVAASWGHAKVLQVLLEGGGSPWLKDEVGKNAFDYAKESNDWGTMNVLSEFSQKNSENGNVMNILLSRMRNIRTSKKRGSRKGFGSAMKKEKSSTVPHLPTHFEESYEKEEALIDDENIVDLTASDSEDFNSSKNSEDSICSENVEVIKEISTASSSGVSSPVPQSSSSELLSGLECSSVSTCTSGNKQPSSSHSSSLPDFVYSSSHVNTRKRDQETLNYGNETSQPNLTSSCSEMLIPVNTRAFYESREWRTQGSSDVYNREGVPGSSREAKVLESTHSNTLPPRKSIARSSIMGLPKIPLITITEPCTLPDLTEERLAEYNSPRGVPNEHSYLSNRIQRWVNSVSHFSPLATSSEDTFYTCEDNSSVAQRLNTAAFESGLHVEGTDNSLKSCDTVSECYKYADEEKGVVLLEERWLANPVLLSDLTQTDQSTSSTAVLHTDTETIDTERLVNELKSYGIDYGPVTSSTKKVYKLQLRKRKALNASFNHLPSAYSYELQRTLKDKKCMYFMSPGMRLEQVVAQQFAKSASGVNWREGNLKTSFTYLLLDPRITKNLPCRAASLQPKEVWSIFLQSIFYIGKGKRSRPYSHLYEAVGFWKKGSLRYANAKVKRISEIWLEGWGVVCLHVFQNVIPVEAYTREAAMIDAIGVQNLCNMKRSEYYGKATQWYNYDRNIFGVYLLYRSLQIFLSEGERHLSPFDIM